MNSIVTVIDYGVGNLYSVQRALEHCGASRVVVSGEPHDIKAADRLILPGVGAFGDGMKGLRDRSLIEPILAYAESGRPLLGICLGMQMLATESEENGLHRGLNLIPGRVEMISNRKADGSRRKVPFVGWSDLIRSASRGSNSVLQDSDFGRSVYLVHSFHVVPTSPEDVLAVYEYDGVEVTAAIHKDNLTGFQFHPERSGEVGLGILRSFLRS